jgi:hypothetical protein
MLVKMVLTSADLNGWDNIVLWKKDLKGAFNLLNYNPAFRKLFAFLLLNDIVVIHLAGLFGLDRNATCFPSIDTITASYVSAYY